MDFISYIKLFGISVVFAALSVFVISIAVLLTGLWSIPIMIAYAFFMIPALLYTVGRLTL